MGASESTIPPQVPTRPGASLRRSIRHIERRLGCRIAVAVERASGPAFGYRADEVFRAASLAKVPIVVEVLRQGAEGRLDLARRVIVRDTALPPGGSGILHELEPGLAPTIKDLCLLAIAISDNLASNLLLDLVGLEAVNQTLGRHAFQVTRLRRRFLDFAAAARGEENLTTAAEQARLYARIARGEMPGGDLLLDLLGRQRERGRLPAGLPPAARVLNKTGTLDGVCHDTGLVRTPGGWYSIAVLTEGPVATRQAEQAIARLSRQAYLLFSGPSP